MNTKVYLQLELFGREGTGHGNEDGGRRGVARGYQEQAQKDVVGPEPQRDEKGLGAAHEGMRATKPQSAH